MMHRTKKIPIVELNQLLTCKLCNGYFVDATTIIECLHSFCRSCLVRYLEKNKYCPICDVQIHKARPLLNIRPDKTLQNIVYKLVPKLFQNEMQQRSDFYTKHPEAKPSNIEQSATTTYQHLLLADETICLSLCYHGNKGTQRYLRCPVAVTVGHIEKLIRAKYELTQNHRIEILYNQDCLSSHLTIMDVAYIYLWRKKGPLELTFRIYENVVKICKDQILCKESQSTDVSADNNNDWKEVQLRISESGEMSITGINGDEKESNIQTEKTSSEEKELKSEPQVTSNGCLVTTQSSNYTVTTTVTACRAPVTSTTSSVSPKPTESVTKRKAEETISPEEPAPKQKILNHTLGLQRLSNNHPLKKHSRSTVENGSKLSKSNVPCYVPKTTCNSIINIPKPMNTVKLATVTAGCNMKSKTRPTYPIGYKTLRDPPKTWNPQITRPPAGKTDFNEQRPPKFFKMRNNMPRYLGNPASGVKPMYQLEQTSTTEKEQRTTSEIKKHSIVKVDPKTLKPISEKAPETSNLTHQSDHLKINTSSVPIFNPLKLNSERNKSPNSLKREKPNLNFTPPNPFVPNLASPTINPNQFLYPTAGPQGFPPYDPRLVAAYHSLLYGQRVPFSPLTLDMASPQSLKTGNGIGVSPNKGKKESNGTGRSLQDAVDKLTQNRCKESKDDVGKEAKKSEESVAKKSNSDSTPKANEEVKVEEKKDATNSKSDEQTTKDAVTNEIKETK